MSTFKRFCVPWGGDRSASRHAARCTALDATRDEHAYLLNKDVAPPSSTKKAPYSLDEAAHLLRNPISLDECMVDCLITAPCSTGASVNFPDDARSVLNQQHILGKCRRMRLRRSSYSHRPPSLTQRCTPSLLGSDGAALDQAANLDVKHTVRRAADQDTPYHWRSRQALRSLAPADATLTQLGTGQAAMTARWPVQPLKARTGEQVRRRLAGPRSRRRMATRRDAAVFSRSQSGARLANAR